MSRRAFTVTGAAAILVALVLATALRAEPVTTRDAVGETLRGGGNVVVIATGTRCRVTGGAAMSRTFRDFSVPVSDVRAPRACVGAARAAFGFARRDRRLETAVGLRRVAAARVGGNTFVVVPVARARAALRTRVAVGEGAIVRRGRVVRRVAPDGWEPLLVLPPQPEGAPFREYRVPTGTHPHDVAPAPDGTVWYTEQHKGALGRLDPRTGRLTHVPLGAGSAPHGVVIGPDGAAWVTDEGLNANVRVDPQTLAVRVFPVPTSVDTDLNTGVFDRRGVYWFTGQAGFYGRLDPATGVTTVWPAPEGPGPYGIAATPNGDVYYASLQGSHIGRVDIDTGAVTVLEPPTPNQGARRIWSDSRGRLWISEWNAGQVGMYDPATNAWREWRVPGSGPKTYAVYVDDRDIVWLSDYGIDALVRFDPATEQFQTLSWPTPNPIVPQLLGRPGEVWGAESATDKLVLYRSG